MKHGLEQQHLQLYILPTHSFFRRQTLIRIATNIHNIHLLLAIQPILLVSIRKNLLFLLYLA